MRDRGGRPWFIVSGTLIAFILALAGRTVAGWWERLVRVASEFSA